ncbi:ATP-binding cassette domain-containing protein [Paenibacillus physcomitrellae]|uniref:ABC transporter domain-containing protein n=1 Tax=Paenibacillus physcomitrellae TaxID=1619311 RepID=A0ABQ1GNH9_9BACL|nr:ATP-binding cassette domain-containing protein [Paenibacillus physcomitrellae]GGA47208.1 hypothetical protein GCM10010917_35590 [Paenibacillus physcomitrellae]
MPITIKDVAVYADRQRSHALLRDIDCVFPDDRSLTLIIGKSGSGKTTLLRTMAGLMPIGSGNVYYDELPLWNNRRLNRAALLRSSVAFQFPEHQLFARTVQGEFDYSLRPYRLPRPDKQRRISAALDGQHLPAEFLARAPFTLSGGQKRRVALASVMATEAPWLLLDEPSAGLDAKSVLRLKQELVQWKERAGIVLVTHEMDTFLSIADRVLILDQGQLIADLKPEELAANPQVLLETGIGLTSHMELAQSLREAGLPVPEDAVTPEQMADVIERELRGEGLSTDPESPPAPAAFPALHKPHKLNKHTSTSEDKAGNGIMAKRHKKGLYSMDARLKWLVYMLISAGIILQSRWAGTGIAFLCAVFCMYFLMPEDRRKLLRMSKPLLWLMAVTVLIAGVQLHGGQGTGGRGGIGFSFVSAGDTFRRLLLFFEVTIVALIFTLSTSTSAMKQGLAISLRPLKRVGVPVDMLALSASLVLRFIPLIIEEADRFSTIARARGKRTSRGGNLDVRDIPAFVIPLLIALFQAVEEWILAMEIKGAALLELQPASLGRDKRWEKLALITGITIFALLFLIRIYDI